jgi:hypothetical protein
MLFSKLNNILSFKSKEFDLKPHVLFKNHGGSLTLFIIENFQISSFLNAFFNRFYLLISFRPSGRVIIL